MESGQTGSARVRLGRGWASTSGVVGWSFTVAVLATTAYLALEQYGVNLSVAVLGILSLIYGATIFLLHGGGRCTVLGLYNLAQALFVGYTGLVLPGSAILEVPIGYLHSAVYWSLLCVTFVNSVAWRLSAPVYEGVGPPALARHHRQAIIGAGSVLYLGASLAKALGLIPAISYLGEGFAFVGIVAVAAGLVFSPNFRVLSFSTVVIGALFASYTLYNHSGTGRLRIVALGCSLLLLWSLARPALQTKFAVIAVSPLAVWALASIRLAYQESLSPGSSDGRTGLESMLSPLATLAHTIAAVESGWETRSGLSYLTIISAPLPERWQPVWMPPALGYDLVALVSPERVGTEFSVAVTSFGEGVWNFGMAGFFIASVVAVLIVSVSDRLIIWCTELVRNGSLRGSFYLVLALIVGGTVGDFAWNGVHTFGTRIGTRLPAVVVLSVLVLFFLVFFRSVTRESKFINAPISTDGRSV